MEIMTLGEAQLLDQEADKLRIVADEAQVEVEVYSPKIIRVNIKKNKASADDPSFAVVQKPLSSVSYKEDDEHIFVHTEALHVQIQKKPLRFRFLTSNGQVLSEDDPRFGTLWQGEKVTTYRKLFTGERFIGLGEKTGPLNRRGHSYEHWNTDAVQYTNVSDPLYKTLPFFIGLHQHLMYGLFFDNTYRSYFDFGATNDEEMTWFGADGGSMNYYFFGAQSVPEILRDYTWLTGRMEMPPLWSLGYQQCRWSYMSAEEVLEVAENFRKRRIPADVIYCDIDYMDRYKVFTWDAERFNKPEELVRKLKEMGFRLVAILDPGLKIEEGYSAYEEGLTRGYFATYPHGDLYCGNVWPGRCHFPNFFDAEVRAWWGSMLTTLTDPGVEGFWNDMNEPAAWGQNIPPIVKFGKYYMPQIRNAYGLQMAKATQEGAKKLVPNKRPFVLTRAAYSGVQRYSAVWTGDNTANDEHMLLGQRLVNSISLAGVPFVGVDVGGFMGEPSPELMVRWISLGTYMPMFRMHSAVDTERREPWVWGEEYEQLMKKDIEQRYRLLPYLYSMFYQAHATGMPISRTLAIYYPYNEHVYNQKHHNQFFFGDSLMVAPAKSNDLAIEVYLPPNGPWYRLHSDEKFSSDQTIIAPAPLSDLPVFVRAGAIIPMQTVIQHIDAPGDGILELHVWEGEQNTSFLYYEDDGVSHNYQQGMYYKREFRYKPQENAIELTAVQGSFRSKFHSFQLILHGFDALSIAKINGEKQTLINYKGYLSVTFVNDVKEMRIALS